MIYKYLLNTSCEFKAPEGAKLLSIKQQHGKVCAWLDVDPTQPLRAYIFEAVPTGSELHHKDLVFAETVLFSNGDLVFHFFIDPSLV